MSTEGGAGIKLPFRFSELLSGASSIVSVVVVLIGLVVWSARQEGRIGELEHRVQVDNERLADLDKRGTREMAERLGIVNEHVESLKAGFSELLKRLEVVNNTGSQAGLLLAERVANDARQATLTRERVQALDARIKEVSEQVTELILDVQRIRGRLDVMTEQINRIMPDGRAKPPSEPKQPWE